MSDVRESPEVTLRTGRPELADFHDGSGSTPRPADGTGTGDVIVRTDLSGCGAIRRPQAASAFLPAAAALLILFVLVPLAVWRDRAHRQVLSIHPAERTRIVRHELDAMRALCPPRQTSDAFLAHCRERAVFVADFPECTAECRSVIQPFLPAPAR